MLSLTYDQFTTVGVLVGCVLVALGVVLARQFNPSSRQYKPYPYSSQKRAVALIIVTFLCLATFVWVFARWATN